jgi:membrane protein
MNTAKDSLSVPTLQVPSNYSILKRIVNLALAVVAVIICVNLWLLSAEQGSNWHDKQANQLGRSLSLLATQVLTTPLIDNENETISQYLDFLVNDPHVSGVALYNSKGQLLDERKSGTSVLASYRLENNVPLVFVQNISSEGEISGYLRLMINEEKVMQYHSEYQKQLTQQVQVLMLLAAAGAILLTRIFYKLRYRKFLKPHTASNK